MKYIEDNNTDIVCVQESIIPSNSFFRFKDYICVTSTDIKGGEKPPCKITKAVPLLEQPVIDIETTELGNRETYRRITWRRAGESAVEHLVRKVKERAKNVQGVEECLKTVLRSENEENSVGLTSTTEDIGEAFVICSGIFDNPKGKNKGKKKGPKGRGKGGSPTITEHHGAMFMYHKDMENQEFCLNKSAVELHRYATKLGSPT